MRAHRQRNLSRHQKIFLQKRLSHKGYPLWDRTIFGQVFVRGAMNKISKWKVPPTGGGRATTGRGLMLASPRYDGVVPAQTPSLMSLTTLKSRRWTDGAAGRCSACRHRRSTSHAVFVAADHRFEDWESVWVQHRWTSTAKFLDAVRRARDA